MMSESPFAGVERVVSLGSVWELDTFGARYRRFPREEVPRERPEWGDESAGPLQDFVWHGLDRWWVSDDGDRLIVIPAGEGWWPIVAPMRNGVLTPVHVLAVELEAHGIRWDSWNHSAENTPGPPARSATPAPSHPHR